MSAAPIPQGDPSPLTTGPTKWRAEHCTAHHHACDCREWEHANEVERLEDALAASEAREGVFQRLANENGRRAAAAEQSLAGLRAFAQDVMETWPEAAPDGFDLQEYAEKHGLLRSVEMSAPCGEDCGCTEYLTADDWPAPCFRRTSLLTGRPESDAAIDALLPKGEGETS